jgi:hypothetical protein
MDITHDNFLVTNKLLTYLLYKDTQFVLEKKWWFYYNNLE